MPRKLIKQKVLFTYEPLLAMVSDTVKIHGSGKKAQLACSLRKKFKKTGLRVFELRLGY